VAPPEFAKSISGQAQPPSTGCTTLIPTSTTSSFRSEVEESAVPSKGKAPYKKEKRSEGSKRQGVRRLSQPRLRFTRPGVFGPWQGFLLQPAVDTAPFIAKGNGAPQGGSAALSRTVQQETFATQEYGRSLAASYVAGWVLLSTRRWRQKAPTPISTSKCLIPELERRTSQIEETCHFTYAAALHLNRK
jgi:hypothetical protein